MLRVGAIRWDAWVGEMATFGDSASEKRVGLVVERTLGPQKWHYRLPFFAVELGENAVQARGATQAVMDQEIAFAAGAGLDYWAFVFYPPGSGLDTARNLYLSSAHKSEINFSLIVDSTASLKDPQIQELFVGYFGMPEYQKVLGDRPLFYLFGQSSISEEDDQALKDAIAALRQKSIAAGAGDPYTVYMGWSAPTVKVLIEKFGLDAGSAYAEAGSGGIPFSRLARNAEARWEAYRYSKIQVIPWVTTGWDPRPRVERPTPWVTYPPDQWAETAKPDEIAAHLQDALLWDAAHPEFSEANTVIIYAWNEFDEGGWLCPTLGDGKARLDAIRKILAGQ